MLPFKYNLVSLRYDILESAFVLFPSQKTYGWANIMNVTRSCLFLRQPGLTSFLKFLLALVTVD